MGAADPEDGAQATTVRPGALSALLEEIAGADGGASAWDAALRPGAVVGRFELVRELGRGGFGVVWEARDRALGRDVAFKAVTAGARPDVREERLLREAEAAARLAHPNIVTLHDVGRAEPGPYLVYELLRGRTLAARLEQGPVSAREAVRIAVEVAKALAHAHAHGLVHRDLAPGNVFLCDDGQVKVLDFGLAQAFGRRKLDGGTPSYMAPEQRRGAPEDDRTDVFALGVVLHRMLAGELPFREGSSPRSAPRLDVPGAPALGEIVHRMLATDPVERPRDGGEVLDALRAVEGELARAPGSGSSTARARRRRPALRTAALVALGAALGVAIAVVGVHGHRGARRESSIAVLPFADLSPQHDQEYFSDGLAEEILNALAHVDGLRVAGRTSSFAFKGRDEDLREIGRKLGVGNVLEGSVRKAGNRVRVTAQLVELGNGYHLWSETFDRDLGDVFAVQDDIARAVVKALEVKVLPGRAPAAREQRTTSPEAYTAYLIGKQLYARGTPEGFRRAVAAFEKALAADHAYAPAWAGLAVTLYNTTDHGGATDVAAARQRAFDAADRAVALDPDLGEAYSVRGILRANVAWDWRGARADLTRALDLNPGDAHAHRRYALLLRVIGTPEEALAAARKATELDPLFASNWVILAVADFNLRQLPAARAALARVEEVAPDYAGLEWMRGAIALFEGDVERARAAVARDPEEANRLQGAAMIAHTAGDAAGSQRALDELVARHPEKPTMIGAVYAWRGELDAAFTWFHRAADQHDDELTGVVQDPVAEKLRRDARYPALLARMNLPIR